MKRVFIFSPLNEYTGILARELNSRFHYDVHVVEEKNAEEANYKIHHWSEFLYNPIREGAIFYQIWPGSDLNYVQSFLFANPGIAVLHDPFSELSHQIRKASICSVVHNPDVAVELRHSNVYYIPLANLAENDERRHDVYAAFPFQLDSTLRAMGMGKAVLLAQNRYTAFLPDDTVIHIRPTSFEEDLSRYTRELLENDELRKEIGERAKNYVGKHHSLDAMIEGYRCFVEAYDYFRKAWKDPDSSLLMRTSDQIRQKFPFGFPEFILTPGKGDLADRFSSHRSVRILR